MKTFTKAGGLVTVFFTVALVTMSFTPTQAEACNCCSHDDTTHEHCWSHGDAEHEHGDDWTGDCCWSTHHQHPKGTDSGTDVDDE